jgi:DNA-binding NarL/FixJ family response regulator
MTEESKTIRLLLVDDHSLMRAALRETLEREPDIEVVGEAGDGETALAMLHELSPDLVLMDISMPGLNGIEATLRIISEHRVIKVLALSTYLERRFVAHILNAGALGYISKTARIEELLLGVRTVMLGKRYLSSEIAAVMANTPPDKASQARLGRREIAVLKLIAQGRSSPEIAKALYIATGTVEVHRSNIMEKLDLHSIAELTRYAMREALIET